MAMDLTAILFLKAAPLTIFFPIILAHQTNSFYAFGIDLFHAYHMTPRLVNRFTSWLFVISPLFRHKRSADAIGTNLACEIL
jgi:hypothetical protein